MGNRNKLRFKFCPEAIKPQFFFLKVFQDFSNFLDKREVSRTLFPFLFLESINMTMATYPQTWAPFGKSKKREQREKA